MPNLPNIWNLRDTIPELAETIVEGVADAISKTTPNSNSPLDFTISPDGQATFIEQQPSITSSIASSILSNITSNISSGLANITAGGNITNGTGVPGGMGINGGINNITTGGNITSAGNLTGNGTNISLPLGGDINDHKIFGEPIFTSDPRRMEPGTKGNYLDPYNYTAVTEDLQLYDIQVGDVIGGTITGFTRFFIMFGVTTCICCFYLNWCCPQVGDGTRPKFEDDAVTEEQKKKLIEYCQTDAEEGASPEEIRRCKGKFQESGTQATEGELGAVRHGEFAHGYQHHRRGGGGGGVNAGVGTDGEGQQLHYQELVSMSESDSSSLGPTTSSDEEALLQEAGRLVNDGTGVTSASRSSSASSANAGSGDSGGERAGQRPEERRETLLPRERW